ncbi:MAG TPA: TolC family protein [Sphingomonadaceae bacterium]|nr:TolC family protein [Sphingomonadaceae bacterium]
MRSPLLASAVLLLGGCISMAPDQQVPEVASELPDAYPDFVTAGDYRPAAWWNAFQDPVLDGLVDRALDQNLDIAEASARAEQAAAQARVSRAALWPTLNATAGASYSENPLSGSAFGNFPGGPSRLVSETYSLGLSASYEVDLFGKANDDFRAARSDAVAAEQDYRAARLATVAETIAAYFDIVDARRQTEMTLLTADVLADRAERTEERYQRGLAQSFELYQVRQDLRRVEASLPTRENALTSAEGRLALLLADYPQEVGQLLATRLTPRLVFEDIPAGLPAELLAQRPDVAAAWDRLESARLRIGARRAERFPALRLTASTGAQGGSPADAIDFGQNWLLSLAANLTAPLIDGGRISANIRVARATYDQRAAAYGRAVLGAFQEVRTAILSYEEQRQRYRLILSQLDDAKASLDLQSRRYEAGVGDYVGYLDALRGYYQVESSLSAAGRDVALARLGVHRALGGDWEIDGERAALASTETGGAQ